LLTLKFFIAIFSIFVSPQIILVRKYGNLPYSLILFFSLIISFSSIWILTLLSYYLNLPDIFFTTLAIAIFILSIYYLIKLKNTNQIYYIFAIIGVLILLLPILGYADIVYTEWDALVSWHRWGLELYKNIYNPIDAAYPILIPSLYSMVYKIVGSSDIWIFSKLTVYIFPFFALLLPIVLFWESKNKIFIIIIILLYPYLIMRRTIFGEADIPVMLMGLFSLYALIAAEIYKLDNKKLFFKYLYAAILLAGLASITKQAGLIFVIFTLIYILVNFKYIKGNKLVIILYIISILYFLSFLILYYQNSTYSATGNIHDLKKLSNQNQNILYLIQKYLYYPKTISLFWPIKKLFSLEYLYGYLLIFSIVIFIIEVIFRKVKRYRVFALLNLIFLVIGFIMWAKIASYHPRNSLFVDDFLITFIAISINYLIVYLQQIKFLKRYLFLIIFLILALYLATISDKKLYKNQIEYQKNLGYVSEAKLIAQILDKNRDNCTKVYMSDYATMYNYYLKNYQNRLIKQPTDSIKYIKEFVENNCSKGSYIVFRPSTSSYDTWYWIKKLIKEKKLIYIKGYLYFIKPNIKLPSDYFEYITDLAEIKIKNYSNNLKGYIDHIKPYGKNYIINGWAFTKNSIDGTIYLVLKNKYNQYIVNTNKQSRDDVAKAYKLKDNYVGFKTNIYSKNIKKGIYNISILYIDNKKQQYLLKTNNKINIK